MDYRTAFDISRAGMDVEKLRLDTAAANLANMHVTVPPGAKLFVPLRVVSEVSFATQFERSSLRSALPRTRTEEMDVVPRLTYDPGHPDADSRGYVRYPGVDHIGEMMTVSAALRAYQADVAAMNAAKVMATRALEIGGTQ